MIPLYGFLQGDTVGLLILADPAETVASLADKLQQAASVRVAPRPHMRVMHHGRLLDPRTTLARAGIASLDRFDVIVEENRRCPSSVR